MIDRNESTIGGNCNIVTQGNKNIVFVTENFMIVDAEYSKEFKAGDIMALEKNNVQNKMDTGGQTSIPTEGANVYLSINVLFATSDNNASGKIEGLCLGITVTNFNLTHRYFNQPVFETSVPVDGDTNSFYLTTAIGTPIIFPKRLEYGEVFTANYKLPKEIIDGIFTKMKTKNSDATIKAILHTTLGETFYSNEYPVSKIVNVANQLNLI